MSEKTGRRGRRRQTKDRVLQARIPEQLDDELRDRAEQLGLSVSTVVRNTLLHTFDLVEGVVTDSSQIARALAGRDPGRKVTKESQQLTHNTGDHSTAASVLGWQEAILNRNGVCEECNAILPKGQRAAIGVPTGPRAVLLCPDCLAALVLPETEPATRPSPKKKKSTTAASKNTRARKIVE